MMLSKNILILQNLTVKIKKKVILKKINFSFKKGKVYALMGPNGSGKSTLAYAIMGHPAYRLAPESQIIFKNEPIQSSSPDQRSRQGIFLSFQTPLALAGITPYQLLKNALPDINPIELEDKISQVAQELEIKKSLLNRPLNQKASGGERKKLELLQAAILNPQFLIFDEIDTGVDIDALKVIASFLKKRRKGKTYLLITHHNHVLKYLHPDQVLVMNQGEIAKIGGKSLAKKIEKDGYNLIKAEIKLHG